MRAGGRRWRDRAAGLTAMVPLAALAASGCAAYSRVDGRFRDDRSGFEMELPADWLRFNPARPDLVLTRDGLRLERVTVRAMDADHEITDTKRVFRADMTPYDVAELALSLMEAAEETRDFRVTRIDAYRLAGYDGFVGEAAYRDPTGLAMRLRAYGAIVPPTESTKRRARVVQIIYVAPAMEYFERFLPVVERMVGSARLRLAEK